MKISVPALSLSLIFAVTCVATNADTVEEMRVIGQKLENALSMADYYNIGLYYGQLERMKWEMEQARIAAAAAAAAAATKQKEVQKCIGMADVNFSLCEKNAYNADADAAISCNAPAMLGVMATTLGMGQAVNACNSARSARLGSNLADCRFVREMARQSCHL